MGIKYEAHPNEKLLEPRTAGEHVWVSVAAFRVEPQDMMLGQTAHLDNENLATLQTGCYVCEQGFDPTIARKKCPGEPR